MHKKSIPSVLFLKAHVGVYTRADGVVVQAHETKRLPASYKAPKEGDVGHHEHSEYGVYFRKGDKVRDQYGKMHEVMEHRGPSVSTYGGQSFHPTKLWHAEPAAATPKGSGGAPRNSAEKLRQRTDANKEKPQGRTAPASDTQRLRDRLASNGAANAGASPAAFGKIHKMREAGRNHSIYGSGGEAALKKQLGSRGFTDDEIGHAVSAFHEQEKLG